MLELINLPDIVLIIILEHLDHISILLLANSCLFFKKFIPNKYKNFNYSSANISINDINFKPYLHFVNKDIIYTHIKDYIIKYTKTKGIEKLKKITNDNIYFIVIDDSLLIFKNDGQIQKCKDFDENLIIKTTTTRGYHKNIIIKNNFLLIHYNSYIDIYDKNLDLFTYFVLVCKLFDYNYLNKIYFINDQEEFCIKEIFKTRIIDKFNDYGGVSCIKVYNDKVYLGLNSGNINIYFNDKFLRFFKAHDNIVYSIAIRNNLIYSSSKTLKIWYNDNNSHICQKIISDNKIKAIHNITIDEFGKPFVDVWLH